MVGPDNNNDIPAEVAAQAGQETINDEQRPGERGGGDGGGGGGGAGRAGGGASQRIFPVFIPRAGGFTGVTGQSHLKTLQNKVTVARARYLLSAAENQVWSGN